MNTHSITGGPHLDDLSWASMERFAVSLKYEDEAICYVAVEVNHKKMSRIMAQEIMLGDRVCARAEYPHTDVLVISAKIGPTLVHRILVDNESTASLLYKNTFDTMRLSGKDPCPCTSAL